MNNVLELSKNNNIILDKINNYKKIYDYECIEGYINEYGIVIGNNGSSVNVSKSYSNMKGIGYKKELIVYDEINCVTSVSNNLDRYILGGSPSKNNISFVIDINDGKYINDIISVFLNNGIKTNILINYNMIGKLNLLSDINYLFKGNSFEEYKKFKKTIDNFYCVKYNDLNIIDICKNNNSIMMREVVDNKLLYYVKNNISKGDIVFIRENKFILDELQITIKYLKSRGINIVSLDELLS